MFEKRTPHQASAMGRSLNIIGVVGAILVTALSMVLVVGMRTKSPGVQQRIRRANKAFWNPRAMEDAGSQGAYAAVIHHVGRRSGASYQTPIVPLPTGDGFVIALPYGTTADWVKNVLATGTATLVHEGITHDVNRLEVVPTAEVASCFGRTQRVAQKVMRVDVCLRLHRADAG